MNSNQNIYNLRIGVEGYLIGNVNGENKTRALLNHLDLNVYANDTIIENGFYHFESSLGGNEPE